MRTVIKGPKKKTKYILFLFILLLLLIVSFSFFFTSDKNKSVENINIKKIGAVGDGKTDDTLIIQKALNSAKSSNKPITITIPKGTYKLTDTLVVYSNTNITLEKGAILERNHSSSIIVNGESTKEYKKYDGEGNITIEGGTLDGNLENYPSPFNAIGIAHGKNISIKNLVVKDIAGGHAIDINGSKDVLIENCQFLGYKDVTTDHSRYYSEAVQIAEQTKLGFPRFGEYDGTPSQDITIDNNYFGPSGTKGTTAWPVGVGNHLTVYDEFNKGIKIINNRFDGMTLAGIRPLKWQDTYIANNTFTSCYIGIQLSNTNGQGESSKTVDGVQTNKPQSGSNYVIENNTFNNSKKNGIFGRGWFINDTLATMDSLTVKGNIFTNQNLNFKGAVIDLSWIKDVTLDENVISNVYKGISISYGSNIKISKNDLNAISTDGISINEQVNLYPNFSNGVTIAENSISDFSGFGVKANYVTSLLVHNNSLETASTNLKNSILYQNSNNIKVYANNQTAKQ